MLWERDEELRRLRAAFEDCRQGRGRTVLISGEPGIGKTSLLRAFAEQVGTTATVHMGACDDLSTARPLGPFRDMFDTTPPAPGEHTAPDREHYLALARAALGDPRCPGLLVVDDAHWADAASLDLIRFLGRRMAGLPGLLLVSYRPGDLADGHPLPRVLGALAIPETIRLELGALSDAVVAHLAERAGRDPAALVAAVGGNPFFLTEVLASGGTQVPGTVRDAVIARVLALPESSRRALEALSVIPVEVDTGTLEAVLGGWAPRALEPAERTGILRCTAGRVGFRHELARRAVEASLPGSVRADLNRRVLRRLVDTAAPAARIVHHAGAAGEHATVARFAVVAAGEAVAARAHSETVAYARLALEHEALLERPVAARLQGLAAEALYAQGRFGAAAGHAAAAVHGWENLHDAPEDLGRVLLLTARMATMNGQPDQARAHALRALAVLRPLGAGRSLAHGYAMMANLDSVQADCAEAVHWAAQALALARQLDLPDVEAYALIYRGLARVGLADLDGLDDLRRAADLAGRLDHGDFRCRAAANLAIALIWLGRHAEARPHLDLAEATAREFGLDYIGFHVRAARSHVDLYRGEWRRAELRLREQVGTDRDPAAMMALPLALLGRILARRGDPGAADLIARAWAIARQCRQAHRLALAGGAVVEHAWLTGDHPTVRTVGTQVLQVARRANLTYQFGETGRYLRRVGVPVTPFPGCPDGFAAALAGDPVAAARAWRDAGNPYEQALAEVEAADAATAFAGLRRLDELGAAATAATVRRDLHRRGLQGVPRGPRAATRAHPAGLTARQQDVLALLATGLTTAGIARRLYLSPRTVDNHIGDIMTRLGAASRREAVATAAARGWLPQPG